MMEEVEGVVLWVLWKVGGARAAPFALGAAGPADEVDDAVEWDLKSGDWRESLVWGEACAWMEEVIGGVPVGVPALLFPGVVALGGPGVLDPVPLAPPMLPSVLSVGSVREDPCVFKSL